jgi:hypothetical protein
VAEIDEFASSLLEESKRFLERANDCNSAGEREACDAYLHSALTLAFCALEAHTNAIADEFAGRSDITIHERAVLLEQDIRLDDGQFVTSGLKMYRLEDRILFLHRKFSGEPLDRNMVWWGHLHAATDLRNQLTHPRARPTITIDDVKRAMEAIIETIDALYRAIYKTGFPAAGMQLQSKLTF